MGELGLVIAAERRGLAWQGKTKTIVLRSSAVLVKMLTKVWRLSAGGVRLLGWMHFLYVLRETLRTWLRNLRH